MSKDNKLAQIKENKVWKDMGSNWILEAPNFFISYNPNTLTGIPMFAGDGSGEETALVKDGQYFILNGDFRSDYEELLDQGFKACKKFFDSKPELKSFWSN